jgi:hypothetical protein
MTRPGLFLLFTIVVYDHKDILELCDVLYYDPEARIGYRFDNQRGTQQLGWLAPSIDSRWSFSAMVWEWFCPSESAFVNNFAAFVRVRLWVFADYLAVADALVFDFRMKDLYVLPILGCDLRQLV